MDNYNIFTKGMLQLLLRIPSARIAREMEEEDIKRILDEISPKKGRKLAITPHEIVEIAHNTISIDDPNREEVLKSRIRRLFQLEEELDSLTRMLMERIQSFRTEEMNILTSIPGIGELSAAVFLAEIGDINCFVSSYKKLIAYTGFDPVIVQSGKFKGQFKISKRGSPHLRRIIWSMTCGVIFWSNTFNNYYKRKRAEGMRHKKAVIATSNKLLRIIFTLLITKTCFQESCHEILTPNYS